MTARRASLGAFLFAAALLGAAALVSPARSEPVETALTVPAERPSRLVLAHWPSAGWLVRQSGRLVELTFPGARIAIPTEAVVLPAAGGAVIELSSEITDEGTVLRVGLGCDCMLAVRGEGPRLLIDVVGAVGDAGRLNRSTGPAPRLARAPRPRPTGDDVAGASGEQEPDLASEINETRSRLLDQLQRAADAGLVKLRPGRDGLLAALRERLSIGDPSVGAEDGVSEPSAGFDGPGPTVDRVAAPVRPVRADYAGPQFLPGAVTSQGAPVP